MLGRVVVGLWLAILAVVPAAAQDYPRGMEAYRQGNYLAALRNWRPLAERGHAPSQSSLGFLYNYGHGVERNYRQALKWYRKAAQQGFAPAQYHLGFLYTKGLGVAQDYVKAHMWFELGAVGGLSYSDKNRAIVARRMTPEQIAEARDLARNWRAAAEKRLRGGVAAKKAAARKAAAKKAAARKAAARKAAARKAAAQRAKRGQQADAPPKPKSQAMPAMPDRVTPERTAVAAAPSGKAEKTALRKASATVPEVKTSETPVPQLAADASEARTKTVETAAKAVTGAPAPQAAPQADKVARRSAKLSKSRKSKGGSGSVLLQLGASKSRDLALKAITRIAKKHEDILGDIKIRAVRKDLGARGIYYRLRAGPIEDAEAGRALCRKLAASGQSCLLLKP